MANTFTPIQTYTLASTTSSITFSNIPQNYTDLKVVVSARADTANTGYERRALYVAFNGSLSNITSKLLISASTPTSTSYTTGVVGWIPAADATATVFGNAELTFVNYTSGNYKSYSVDIASENNTTDFNKFTLNTYAGLWSVTSPITSLTFTVDTASFVAGSTFTLYGISNGVKATGGTLTVAGGYAYHTFTSTGSFLPNQQIKGAEVLAVAGGGGGGYLIGGGGGAGGVAYGVSQTFNAGQTYTALVGSGGAGSTSGNGSPGGNSVISGVVAVGGGYGPGNTNTGGPGGSGGGGSRTTGGSTTQTSGTNYVGYGYAGGTGNTAPYYEAAGGGGAGAVGGDASGTTAGNGGIGISNFTFWHSITGTGIAYGSGYYIAGGGGGGTNATADTSGLGGIGGGGHGGKTTDATAGTANTGGGGGGGAGDVSYRSNGGQAGGSGLIIVRYPLA